MASSDYVHGKMDVKEQSSTFDGFIKFSLWAGLIVGLGVFALVLVYGAHYPWLGAALGMVVLGGLIGALLKMGNSWFYTLAGIGLVCVIASVIEAMVKAFS